MFNKPIIRRAAGIDAKKEGSEWTESSLIN
jgi:hypothetical protein